MRALVYATLAAYWAACIVWSRRLPDRYPIHFNLAGQPDRWASGSFEWFLLPVIATATVLIMIGIGKLSNRAPHLWNIPEKKRFLALTAAQRAPIIDELTSLLDLVALYTLVVFVVCQWAVYRAAMTASGGLPVLFHVVVWGGIVVLLAYILRMNGRVKAMILSAGGAPPS